MPILVKDFTWRQSEDLVSIRVPLKGIHYSKVDVILSQKYIKLHYPPFLFEAFLFASVKESEGECSFTKTEAIIELVKDEHVNWESFECEIDKKERIAEKEKIISQIQTKKRKELDDKIQTRIDLDRFAVQEAIDHDTKVREKIDNLRNTEREIAMGEFQDWKEKTENVKLIRNGLLKNVQKRQSGVKITELTDDEVIEINKDVVLKKNQGVVNSSNNFKSKSHVNEVKNICAIVEKPKHSEFYTKVMSNIESRIMPSPRETRVLNVSFTERIFPTPKRESSSKEEEIWLKKINEARRASGFVSEDLRPEEQDPQWCKDKGDEFFKMGNFFGAISAYSHGIKLSDQLPSLYSNRAASQFALGNFNKCVEDCSTALDLLKPHCDANLSSRVRCITRRAAALTRLGLLTKAIGEMKSAIKLQPDDQVLKEDLYNMEHAWEQDPDSD